MQFAGISVSEPPEKAAEFRARHGLTYPVLSDPDRKVYGRFFWPVAYTFPYTVVIGRDGRVRNLRVRAGALEQLLVQAESDAGVGGGDRGAVPQHVPQQDR